MKLSKKKITRLVTLLILLTISGSLAYYNTYNKQVDNITSNASVTTSIDISNIPEYTDSNAITINNNVPYFSNNEINTNEFETYSELDNIGRCGVAYALIGTNTMPTDKRGSIGMIKPTGWHTVKYDIVDGKYLYNRCHLIGYQLAGENANPKNLITCTRNMNAVVMLKYEDEVAAYVRKTNNHVLYRVTPYFKDDNLLATGVEMEAYSVEDNGEGVKFNVFVYHVEEGINIYYTFGDSSLK